MTLRDLRQSKKLTQSELGNLIGVTQREVAAYERGTRNVPPKRAKRIAETFNLSIEQIWVMLYEGSA